MMLATLRPVMVLVAATVLSCGTLLTPQAATTAYPSTASSILQLSHSGPCDTQHSVAEIS